MNIMDDLNLENGQEVTINIPFTYTIGDEGYNTGKELKTIQDCKDEVVAELKSGHLIFEELMMKVEENN